VQRIIINNMNPNNVDCPFCKEKNEAQSQYLQEITNYYRGKEIIVISAQPQEVKGPGMLSCITEYL